MILKLILVIGVVYLFYKVRQIWKTLDTSVKRTVPGDTMGKIDDVMVKDPYCNVYFPKRSGIPLNVDGETTYFCSTECRDAYTAALRSKT